MVYLLDLLSVFTVITSPYEKTILKVAYNIQCVTATLQLYIVNSCIVVTRV